MNDQTFREWGILEIMGRLRLAGVITEQTIAGAGMIRIDVPQTKTAPAFTRFFAPSALYSLTPTTEEIARAMAESWRETPITRFDLAQIPANIPDAPDQDADQEEEDRD